MIIANYAILPDFLVTLPALVLPWLELVAGLCLAAGLWTRSSALLLSLLLLVFIVALGFNALRGIDLSCGCFSTSAADTGERLCPDFPRPADAYPRLGDLFLRTGE